MPGTIKMFCIRMNILSHRNNIVLFLACNMAAMQNLYTIDSVRKAREAHLIIKAKTLHPFGINRRDEARQ